MANNYESEKSNMPVTRSRTSAHVRVSDCTTSEREGETSGWTGGGGETVTETDEFLALGWEPVSEEEKRRVAKEAGGFKLTRGMWSRGAVWSKEEYEFLWECYELSYYRERGISWTESLFEE